MAARSNRQPTRRRPRCLVCCNPAEDLIQPNISSILLRTRRLAALPDRRRQQLLRGIAIQQAASVLAEGAGVPHRRIHR